ncbi:hypothetical protein Tco_1366343, partial [Tanacetum coccineum]
IELWWKWRYHIPMESIYSHMLTLNLFNQRHHDNQKTYNTASATLISNVMIKKSVSMPVQKSQRHMKFMEKPVEIMEWEIKQLKQSRIPLVKIRWNSKRGPEFTWEREDSFKQKYP